MTEKVRDVSVSEISTASLREKLADCLEYTPSIRLQRCVDEGYISFSQPIKLPTLFLLQHFSGYDFIKQFADDESKKKLGAIFLAEYLGQTDNAKIIVNKLNSAGWHCFIDPSTHKLIAADSQQHAKLKNHDYYRAGLSVTDLVNTEFKQKFIADVINFQCALSPSLLSSPYFFVKFAKDPELDLTIQLYDDCKNYLASQNISTPLALGLCISEGLVKNGDERHLLLDQLVALRGVDLIYIKAEHIKKDNSPCSDATYLSGLKEIAEVLGRTKRLIFSQVDQSSLGLIASENVSVGVSPEIGLRKNSIEEKIQGKEKRGYPKAENRRYKYYVPPLLNDLDIAREYLAKDINKFIVDHSLVCMCPYCKNRNIDESTEAKVKKLHFVATFSDQVTAVRESSSPNKKLGAMIEEAENIYKEMARVGINIAGESSGDFLTAWKDTFLK